MSREVTKTDEFQPTPAMVVWLDTAAKSITGNVSEISKECNISRQSWHRWMRSGEFREWFKKEWEKALAGVAWKLDVIGLQRASEDYRYWETMQKRVGNLPLDSRTGLRNAKAEFVFKSQYESPVVYLPRRLDEEEAKVDKRRSL